MQTRFYYQPLLQALTFVWFTFGGVWMFAGAAAVFGITAILDELFRDHSGTDRGGPWSDLPLHLTWLLVFGLAIHFVCLVGVSSPGWGGVVAHSGLAGELLRPQPWWALLGGALCLGMHVAAAAGNVGHEFAHRTTRPALLSIAQWLSALALHTSFPIEHVVGHHRNVATNLDPTTARRGEGFWRFIMRSVLGAYRNARRYEAARCRRQGLSSIHNRAFLGYGKQGIVLVAVFLVAGAPGLVAFLVAGLIAMVIIEQFNYVAHYGLVRVPGQRVRAEHSWNWSRLGSTSFMFNLTRHSAHHLSAAKRFWELPGTVRGTVRGPAYPFGPFLMVVIALIPPLFRYLTACELARWDETFATASERSLLARDGGSPSRRSPANWLQT